MGITGLLKHLGPGERTALAVLAAQFFVDNKRPLRLAIDISIWLFHIQAGQGGSNPAVRTFYYRLLRLVSLNIHPLFVFDGPNKPLFKRNKRVGGPGVKVVTVPEFLAKQLLKQFGMPMHTAPGEAEAECAHLQRLGVIDAVLSDDVDTIMFGSTLTLRNWSTEGSSKTPTHVNVYKSQEVFDASGIDRQGMILVAMMSGGDYLPAGIMGCGPRISVDAAKAGFAQELCDIATTTTRDFSQWRQRLQEELMTNASKFFSRRNTTLQVPEDFPNMEVLGYYTKPCVSSATKVEQLRRDLRWSEELDFASLRELAGDAFDWHNLGGAQKFIRNLAPSVLARELRLSTRKSSVDKRQPPSSSSLVCAIHGQRQHASVDNRVELRISYLPNVLIPIDLSAEPEDDPIEEGLTISTQQSAADIEEELAIDSDDEGIPSTPSRRKRKTRPFDPTEPAKVWLLREWVQMSYPDLVEAYEAQKKQVQLRTQQEEQRKLAKARNKKPGTRGKKSQAAMGMPSNALMRHFHTSKPLPDQRSMKQDDPKNPEEAVLKEPVKLSRSKTLFMLPSTQIPASLLDMQQDYTSVTHTTTGPQTPRRRKRDAATLINSPATSRSIAHYFTPSRSQEKLSTESVIDLVSPSPTARILRRPDVAREDLVMPNVPLQSPTKLPRAKFRKSLSLPAAFGDDTEAYSDKLHESITNVDGSLTKPIELSPDVGSKWHVDERDIGHIYKAQTLSAALKTASKQGSNEAGSALSSSQPAICPPTQATKQPKRKSTAFGHRLSEVDFLDLT